MRFTEQSSFGVIPLKIVDQKWYTFIVLHKHGQHWGFPKGKPDPGEEPKQSASRELQEETGLSIEQFLQEAPLTEEYVFFKKTEKVHKKVAYYLALVSGEISLQEEEIQEGKWVLIEEVEKKLTFQELKNICKQAVKILHEISL